MIDVNKKIEKIEKNCIETAKKELALLKNENDTFSEEKILEKVDNYKIELSKKYELELNKIKREYNRNIYDYEMNAKRRVNNVKEIYICDIENKIKKELENFVDSDEYELFLFRNIENMLKKVSNSKCIISITEKDYNKFHNKIATRFNANIEKIDNGNIGGCILTNLEDKISIDNTLKNNIEEKIKKISI